MPERTTTDLSALLQNQAALDQIGAEILSGGPRAIRYCEADDGLRSMVFVARRDDVISVLTDEAKFSVRHYDPLYGAVAAKGARLIMCPKCPERTERLEILHAAEKMTPWFGADSAPRRALVKECVEEVLAVVRGRGRFDLIGEYGFFVPYLVGERVLGLTGPRTFEPLSLLTWLVNCHSPFQFFKPKIEPYMTDLAWSEFVIAQLLINFENRQPLFRWVGAWCAKQLRAHVGRLVDQRPEHEGEHTLLSALWAVRDTHFPDVEDDVYREHVISIMMELLSTLLVVPGLGFTGIVERWLKPGVPGLKDSLRQLEAMDAEEFVQEELRLAPPSAHLLRNATGRCELGGLTLEEGEYVCALVKSAGLDIADDPGEVRTGRCPSDYLHFGPEDGPHRCAGHRIAPSILAEMFLGMTRLPGLAPRNRVISRGLVPGRMTVEFSKPEQYPPFLICVPIEHDPDSPDLAARKIEALLDQLGNPANDALKKALDATKVIHFLSLSVVWDEDDADPPILLADVAADGTPETIIAALVEHAGALLLPVYQAVKDVKDLTALQDLLEDHWVNPVAASWPLRSHLVTGLAFQGTPGLTLERIREDEKIALAARTEVFGHTPSAALSYVYAARAAAGIAKPMGKPFNYSDDAPSLSRAGFFGRVWAFLSLIVFDWSFLIIVLLTLSYLNAKDLLEPIVNDSPVSWPTMLFAIPLAFVFGATLNAIIKFIKMRFKREISDKYLYLLAGGTILATFLATLSAFRVSAIVAKIWSPQLLEDIQFYPFAWWVSAVLGLLSLVLFLVLVAGVLIAVQWALDNSDKPCDADPDARQLADIIRREDLPPHKQNHMISVSTISPGPSPSLFRWFVSLPATFFRRFVSLPAGLYVASLTVRSGMFRTGFLAGISTIHFIQWARIPLTGKLVFTANYDGSLPSYLEDAITLLPGGATGIWSNTKGFPKTNLLFFDGAKDGDRFKRWVRRQMIPTRFWYSAYPHLTATDIRLNAAIRQGLEAKVITASQAEAWLKLFGSAPRPVSEIESEQIQGLALNGYRNLLEGVMVALTFPDNTVACRAWLAGVSGEIAFGDFEPTDRAMAVALSASGLKRLGLADPLAAQFSPAFAMGMANEARKYVLGDVGDNAPGKWGWGGPGKPVDAVLLIYAADWPKLKARLEDEFVRWRGAGLTEVHKVTLRRWPPSRDPITHKKLRVPIKEPFGFVDGISQPSIRGLLSSRGAVETDLLEPGEFILGYPDGREKFPPTPQVFAKHDRRNRLPDLPPNFPPPPSSEPVRDLGRNGSYLVIRQLKQHVAGYRAYVNRAATHFPALGWGAPDWVAAKMVGRWPNGAPLVLFPDGPPGPDDYSPIDKDEDFLFGRDDPQGLACPFGAHIRRANPRDQFDADNMVQMSITNRHRIVRRGRAYVDDHNDSGADPQGLLFMCLNADIERQFEFLQQTWIGSTSFGPLRDEADPLTAMNRTNGTYTIPTLAGPQQLTGMSSFVSMIGGGYFFLPGRQALAFLSR